MKTRKEPIDFPELGLKVRHESIYDGNEEMVIVGIRKTELELEGDYSGGTHKVFQKSWVPKEGCFRLRKVCSEKDKPNGCQLHNIQCSYPNCEPFI